MPVIISIILLVAAATAAVCDLSTGKIPNWLTYSLAGLAFVVHSALGPFAGMLSLIVMIAVLAASLPVFSCGWLRGGDVKMMVACCGLVSYELCVTFLLWTMFCGGILALVVAWRYGTLKQSFQSVGAAVHPLLRGVVPKELPFTTNRIPYGVAIFGGALLTALAMTVVPALRL